jgi:simple sugar transport system ATP-binding protein
MAAVKCIEVTSISMEFPGVKALQNVSCSFPAASVKALVGANGAGKSTLMKILAGVNPSYTGEVYINGENVRLDSPDTAKNLGIEIVYQEVDTALISNLSVAENVMIEYIVYGMKHKNFINWQYVNKTAKAALDKIGIDINHKSLVSALSLAQKQMVLIARAVQSKCRYLILDEPTAPLSLDETKRLFSIIKKLKDDGVGVIFISHRLNELFEICEEITVLRDGRLTGTTKVDSGLTIDKIVDMMLGETKIKELDRDRRGTGKELLKVENFSDREGRVHSINLTLHEGEIVGLSGLIGAGKTELCKTLFGVYGKQRGMMLIKGKTASVRNPYAAVMAGMAFIPEERRKEGVVVNEPVFSNLSLATMYNYTGFLSFLKKRKELSQAEKKIMELKIKTPSPRQKVMLLSGGNQQKVTIGKWIDSHADIYIFDEPTKGIDVGAKAEVYQLIMNLARDGKGIIYSSSEQSEILHLTDRTYVMFDGTIQKEFITTRTNEEQLLFYSTGGKSGKSE